MNFMPLTFFAIIFTTMVSADEVETIKEVRVPQAMVIPKDVVTKVTSVGSGVTDLVKQVKRLEAKLNLVLERVISRKREISKELDSFESGVDSILGLLAPALSEITKQTEVLEVPGKKTVVVEDDDDGDETVTTVQDQPKTIIVKGDRKRRDDQPRRRKREVESIETDGILNRLNVLSNALGRYANAKIDAEAQPSTGLRQKRYAKRRKRDRKNVEARYHISLDNVEPVLIERMEGEWPLRARRRAGSAAVEVLAHRDGPGSNGGESRARRDLDDEEPVPEVELNKRDAAAETTIIEDVDDADDDSAEETIVTEEQVQPSPGQTVLVIDENDDEEAPDIAKKTKVKETDVVTAGGDEQTIIEEVEETETADDEDDDSKTAADDEDDDGDDDDDDDEDNDARSSSDQNDDGGSDASNEDRRGPIMVDGSSAK